MKKSCIDIQHITQIYGTKKVLSDVHLQIPSGCIYGILGPSGCGKTTLVKAIAGILKPTEGCVKIFDEEMPKLSIMNRIGYMAQSDALYMNLSGQDNMEFFAAMYGMHGDQMHENIEKALHLVKLYEHKDKPVGSYSGGMKRRLSLALAVVHNPEILILDEPTVGIDPLLRQDIWAELNKMCERGTTIIVTTHVMDEADRCHLLTMMRDGMIIANGTPEEIKNIYQVSSIEEAFIKLGKSTPESEASSL